jgi:glycosyltransferase involved in cell wall biosynthesis
MPTLPQLQFLENMPGCHSWVKRLERRYFKPLIDAPRVEGPWNEWCRMASRVLLSGTPDEASAYRANDWLMSTMKRECRRKTVTAVHSYEDCSLWQFEEAKRLGKKCIYDMPIGYYPAWEETEAALSRQYADWLPPTGLSSKRYVRPAQKQKEMELADIVLAPSAFVRKTILRFIDKQVAIAPYGVDLNFWRPTDTKLSPAPLRFLYAGQCSLRKGTPLLLEAWRAAALKDATLELVGPWQFADARRRELPDGVTVVGPQPPEMLRLKYQQSDIFVFATFFEGRALAVGEALACGVPVLMSDASGWDDAYDVESGRVFPAGNKDALIDCLLWFGDNRGRLPIMKRAARAKAETYTWRGYRTCVAEAVSSYV